MSFNPSFDNFFSARRQRPASPLPPPREPRQQPPTPDQRPFVVTHEMDGATLTREEHERLQRLRKTRPSSHTREQRRLEFVRHLYQRGVYNEGEGH